MLKPSLYVSGLSLITQAIGFVKLLLIANYFGVSAALDGYYLALTIPTLLLGFIGGALQTGFVPVYGRLLVLEKSYLAAEFRSTLLWLLLGGTTTICVALALLAEPLISLIVSGSSAGVKPYAVYSFRILIFTLALNTIADFFSLVLNTHQKFCSAALAPAINALIASAILGIRPDWGLDNLIYGLVAGLTAQILIVGFALYRLRSGFSLSINLNSNELKRAGKLMLPVLLGAAVANANISIDQVMATIAGEGSVSILGYASRFHNVIAQAGIIGISVVLLPTLVQMVGKKQIRESLALLDKLFLISLIASISFFLVILYFGKDVLEVLIVRGEFTPGNLSRVYEAWLCYTLGLFPMACGVFYAKFYQALQMPWIITKLAVLSCFCNVALNFLLIDLYGVIGIPLSTTLVYTLIAIIFYGLTNKMRRASD